MNQLFASSEEEEDFGRKAIKNFLDVFIMPEVSRRQDLGEFPKPLDLRAAQTIFYADGRKPLVRINEEVRAFAKVKFKDGIVKNPGDTVYENELDGLEGLTLTAEEDPDCGHATLVRIGQTWLLSFDFIYNKGLSRKHIEAAEEFIAVAKFALGQKYWVAFVDSLFSAAELLAKAVLLCSFSDADFRTSATHKAIHNRFNRFAHLGNVNPGSVETFNKLAKMRYPTRYLEKSLPLSFDEAQAMLTSLEVMLEDARRLVIHESMRNAQQLS